MRAEAARAEKRFKHAVMSYETGQNFFYWTLAAMTDGQLLAALEAGSIELSISGATPPAHQPTPPTSQHPAAPSRSLPNQPAQPTAQPSQPKKEASPLQQQQQAGPLDRHQGWGRQQRASQGQQSEDSLAQPGTSSQNPRRRTSQQRKRLKHNRPRPRRIKQPIRRRQASPKGRR
jgi:hypothetical protein